MAISMMYVELLSLEIKFVVILWISALLMLGSHKDF